jgi:hypothetical protein
MRRYTSKQGFKMLMGVVEVRRRRMRRHVGTTVNSRGPHGSQGCESSYTTVGFRAHKGSVHTILCTCTIHMRACTKASAVACSGETSACA